MNFYPFFNSVMPCKWRLQVYTVAVSGLNSLESVIDTQEQTGYNALGSCSFLKACIFARKSLC